MCMEVLSKSLGKAAREGQFGFHLKCKVLNLTHLIFAGDLIIFTYACMHSLLGIKSVLDTFYSSSRLKVLKKVKYSSIKFKKGISWT